MKLISVQSRGDRIAECFESDFFENWFFFFGKTFYKKHFVIYCRREVYSRIEALKAAAEWLQEAKE